MHRFLHILIAALAVTLLIPIQIKAQSLFINEVHYDNRGNDEGEGIEIAGPADTDLSDWQVYFYNGGDGDVYASLSLDGTTLTNTNNGYGFHYVAFPGIQNGSPDGISLVKSGSCIQFLSYEGSIEAIGSPCQGQTSEDIGVSEGPNTPVGQSLQLSGNGSVYEDFFWIGPTTNSFGFTNVDQTFSPNQGISPNQGHRIDQIQGIGFESPLIGENVKVVDAIVTYDKLVSPQGIFIQQRETDDSIVGASRGIFVYLDCTNDCGSKPTNLDEVDVEGVVGEYNGLTQITIESWDNVTNKGKASTLPPQNVMLPVDTFKDMEPLESMLVTVIPDPQGQISLSGFHNFERFGYVLICYADFEHGGRVLQFTQHWLPNASEYSTYTGKMQKGCLLVDDDTSEQNPSNYFVGGILPVNRTNFIRGGDVIKQLTGVIHQNTRDSSKYYRIYPTSIEFEDSNPRPGEALCPGDTRFVNIAVANVLNYFTSIDVEKGFRTQYRGADFVKGYELTTEFDRQASKTVTALSKMNADIYGFMEVENTNYGAILDLASRLSQVKGMEYKAVSVTKGFSRIGDDAIRVDLLYDENKMKLVDACYLNDALLSVINPHIPLPVFDGPNTNRYPLAAHFTINNTYEVTVVVIHLKSKGGSPSSGPDSDAGDGAGAYNTRRLNAAKAILTWIGSDEFCGSSESIVLVGDFNAYAMEDPIQEIVKTFDSVKDLTNKKEYSYVFSGQWGTLDYGFVRNADSVTCSNTWHVNSDEFSLFDYNLEFNRDPNLFTDEEPIRFSDHDPLLFQIKVKENEELIKTEKEMKEKKRQRKHQQAIKGRKQKSRR